MTLSKKYGTITCTVFFILQKINLIFWGQKMNDKIVIKGAKEHNLKNIDLEIPRDKLVVLTGLSGSRKIFFSF